MKSKVLLAVAVLALSLASFAQQPVNQTQINGTGTSTGNGVTGTGSQRVTIASDNTAFAVNATLSAETTKVIGTVNMAAAQTIAVTNTGTFATQSTLAAETTKVIGTVNVAAAQTIAVTNTGTFAVQASFGPATSGGLTMAHLLAAATNNATAQKASAGQLYGAAVYNNANYPVYLKFYNKASAPTPASDTIVYEMPVQAGTQREVHTEEGMAFATGIAFALVKGISDTDNTSVSASDATVDLIYK